jgi:hypothetical protein
MQIFPARLHGCRFDLAVAVNLQNSVNEHLLDFRNRDWLA